MNDDTRDKRNEDEPSLHRAYLGLRSVLHDRVTGLPAFPVLMHQLRGALETRRRLGVLHVELAGMDLVESLYGWQVFDRLLERVADALRDAIGKELPASTLLSVSHVAGERFTLFVLDRGEAAVDPAGLLRAADGLRTRLEHLLAEPDLAGMAPRLVPRVGHALIAHDPFHRFERLVHAAVDEARQLDVDREKRRELSWGEELRALIRDRTVDVVFQPIVELASGSVIGHEALARGPRDTLFEMPGVMFALSDRLGIDADLDRVCRQRALSAGGNFPDRGELFLNIRPRTLDPTAEAVHALRGDVVSAGILPEKVVLELSERAAGPDTAGLAAALQPLREEGYRLALDDVGTAWGSRELVTELRPDFVKLDISLVRNVQDSLIRKELLDTLVVLARDVEARVIAEGIESIPELETLRNSGVELGQGFLFAHPAVAPVSVEPRGPQSRLGA